MIEQNSGHIQFDAGSNFNNFDENKLISNLNKINYFDYQGSHWAPHLIHKDTWDEIGGFSDEFNPGMGSDPDLNMKLWKSGVRIFKGLSETKVYHFGSIVTRKYKNHPNMILLDAIYDKDELDYLRGNAYIYIHSHSRCGTAPSLVEAMSLENAILSFDVPTNRETTKNEASYFTDSSSLIIELESLSFEDMKENISSNLTSFLSHF